LYNTHQFDTLKKQVKFTLWIVTLVMLPICILTFFFSETLARLVSNKAIYSELYIERLKTLITALSIPAYLNAVYFCALRLYTSTLQIKASSIIQCAICSLFLGANYIGLKYFHFKGLYTANIIAYILMFIVSLGMIRQFYKMIEKKQMAFNLNTPPHNYTPLSI
jgi:Na+-driven multidrug efflux pump